MVCAELPLNPRLFALALALLAKLAVGAPVDGESAFTLPPVLPQDALRWNSPAAFQHFERVVFHGNTVVSSAELAALAAPYLGRDVGVDELEELRLRLTRLYIDRGYVSSGVVIEEQVGPELRFQVIEGRLAGVRLQGMQGLADDYVVRRLLPPGDAILNMDNLRERFQLLLGDPLFAGMNARVTPGEQAGEAWLDVDVVRARPHQWELRFDNHRPESLGSESVTLAGTLRNLSGQGDQLDLSLQQPTRVAAGARAAVAWRLPLGQRGTQLLLALDHSHSSVAEEPVNALDIRSRLRSREIGLSQTLVDTLRGNLSLGLARVQRESSTSLLGELFSFTPNEPSGITREQLWRFWQEASWRSERQVLALRSTLLSGHSNVRDGDGEGGTAATWPARVFHLWMLQAQYARVMNATGARLVIRAQAQRSPQRLLALDGMAIGGAASVRGFRENQLVRDQGRFINIEYEWPLMRDGGTGLNWTLIPFVDHGVGGNHAQDAVSLSSWGISNRWQWRGLSLDLTLARRMTQPASLAPGNASLQDRGIHFQLRYKF